MPIQLNELQVLLSNKLKCKLQISGTQVAVLSVSLSTALCQGHISEQGEQQLLKTYLLSKPQSRAYKEGERCGLK